MKKEYKVTGMSCKHCQMNVEKALNSVEGVKATVSLDPPVATVEYDGEIPFEKLQEAVTDAGVYQLLQ